MLKCRRRTGVLLVVTLPGLVLVLMYAFFLHREPAFVRRGGNVLGPRTIDRASNALVPARKEHLDQDMPLVCPSLDTAIIQTNLSRLLVILKDPNARQTCAWIRMRVTRMWPQWVKSIYSLAKKQDMSNRGRQQVLMYLGFLSKKANWGFAETQFKGGFLGELVVWSDLIATLYVLGHNVTVTTEFEEVKQHLEFFSDKACRDTDSIIYTDIVGLTHMSQDIQASYTSYKCRLRILDSFGTEAAFNHETFSKQTQRVTDWGGWNLRLQQFYNMFPHTPDDTFLGFVVQSNITKGEHIDKENIAVVYGKGLDIWKGKDAYIKQFHKAGLQVHGTVNMNKNVDKNQESIPDFVINHGVIYGGGFQTLLRRAKLFIGLGDPLEGPAALESIANGAVFINPKLESPLNYRSKGKPTERVVESQNPYLEQFVGEPYVYTINTKNKTEVETTIKKILKTNQFEPFLPYEYSEEGYIQRINSFVEHQDFCRFEDQSWPPEAAVKIILGKDGVSCKDACWDIDLICEPSHFFRANSTISFKTNDIKCNTTEIKSDIFYPAVVTLTNECIHQNDSLLFSCVGGRKGYSRVCPCRTYVKYQSGLCRGCEI